MIFSNLGVRERRHQLRKFYTLGHLFGEIEPRSSFETGNKPFLWVMQQARTRDALSTFASQLWRHL